MKTASSFTVEHLVIDKKCTHFFIKNVSKLFIIIIFIFKHAYFIIIIAEKSGFVLLHIRMRLFLSLLSFKMIATMTRKFHFFL